MVIYYVVDKEMKYIILLLMLCNFGCHNATDCSASERIKAAEKKCEWYCAQRVCSCNEKMLQKCISACKEEKAEWFKILCKNP